MNIFCKYGTFVHELATMAQEVERRLGKDATLPELDR